MVDFGEDWERQHRLAVLAGAAGRNGEVREAPTYLKFNEVDPEMKKSMKKAMKQKESAPKKKKSEGKLKAKATGKPASSGGQQGPPPKTAYQKRLLDLRWKRWQELNE